jgi:hypothetical protein
MLFLLRTLSENYWLASRTTPSTNADRCRLGHAVVHTDIQFDLPAAVYTRCYTDTIAPPYIAQLESATNTTPGRGGRRGIDEGLGTPRAEELQLRRAEAQHVRTLTLRTTHLTTPQRKMRKSDPVPTQVKRASLGGPQDDDIPMVTERRKSAPRGYP